MYIIYRCSDKGNPKDKPEWIALTACLRNFLAQVRSSDTFEIWCDNCEEHTVERIHALLDELCPAKYFIRRTSLGNSGSFRAVLRELDARDAEDIYLVEDDYWHLPGALDILRETLAHESARSTTFYTLQDHPDNQDPRINQHYPQIPSFHYREVIRFMAGVHWRMTPSTTMTFAGKRWAFQLAAEIMEKHCAEKIPQDQAMWCELQGLGVRLQNAIPGLATHGESAYLCPGVNWEAMITHPGSLRDYLRRAFQSPGVLMSATESQFFDQIAAGAEGVRKLQVLCKEWDHETRAYITYLTMRLLQGGNLQELNIALEREPVTDELRTFMRLVGEKIAVKIVTSVGKRFDACDLVVQAGSGYGSRLSQLIAQNMEHAKKWVVLGTSRQGTQNQNADPEEALIDMERLCITDGEKNKTFNDVLGVLKERGTRVHTVEGHLGVTLIEF